MRGSITLLLLMTLACGDDDTSADADTGMDSDVADTSTDTSPPDAGRDASAADTSSDAESDVGTDTPIDTGPPIEGLLAIDVPAMDALIDTATIVFRGRASTTMGDVRITANGDDVVLDDEGIWSVELEVEPGELEVDIEATLDDGQVLRESRTIRRTEYLASPGAYEFDPVSGEVFFIGRHRETVELQALDIESGIVRTIADITELRTSGGALPADLVLDFENDRFFFILQTSSPTMDAGVWAMDRESGRLRAWATTPLECPTSAVLDPVRARLVVHDACVPAVFVVGTDRPDITVLSADTLAGGPRLLDYSLNLSMDPDEERVIASANRIRGMPTVLGIDLDTGMRTIIADNSGGVTPVFRQPNAVVQPTRDGPAYLLDRGVGLYELNVTTGARRLMVSSADVSFGGVSGLQHRGPNPLILDSGSHLFEVDSATDGVELLASNRFNVDRVGEETDNFVVAGGAAYFWDELELVRVQDGESTTLLTGVDVSPYEPGVTILSNDGSTLYVALDGESNVIGSFDIASGEWSIVSGPTSDGIMLPFVQDLVDLGDRLLALTTDRIINILLPSGGRTLAISPVDPPTATSIQEGDRLVVTEDTYFVLDGDIGLLAINRTSGISVLVEVPGDAAQDIAAGGGDTLLVLSGPGTIRRFDGDEWSLVLDAESPRASRVIGELEDLHTNPSGVFAIDDDGWRLVQLDPVSGARFVLLQFDRNLSDRE